MMSVEDIQCRHPMLLMEIVANLRLDANLSDSQKGQQEILYILEILQ